MTVANAPQLPRYQGTDPAMRAWADMLVHSLEQQLAALAGARGGGAYVITNLTASRALDASGGTLSQVLAVVGTMVGDLQQKGSLP